MASLVEGAKRLSSAKGVRILSFAESGGVCMLSPTEEASSFTGGAGLLSLAEEGGIFSLAKGVSKLSLTEGVGLLAEGAGMLLLTGGAGMLSFVAGAGMLLLAAGNGTVSLAKGAGTSTVGVVCLLADTAAAVGSSGGLIAVVVVDRELTSVKLCTESNILSLSTGE